MKKAIRNANANAATTKAATAGKRRGKPPKPQGETPAMCFERVAGNRLGRMLQHFKGLRALTKSVSSKYKDTPWNKDIPQSMGYYSSEGQWEFIFSELEKEMNKLRKAQKNGGPSSVKHAVRIPKA